MRLKLQFEQLFLCSELWAIRSLRCAMHRGVRRVQNRMRQTQIALLFPGLVVPPNGSASLESNWTTVYSGLRIDPKLIFGLRKPIAIHAEISLSMTLPECPE
jgi:hypothetical protein